MRILISCDMEGISGIVDWEQVTPGKSEWERGRRLMTADVNAAINGACIGGADAVTVSDAHWHMRSLLIEELDPRARLHSGAPSPFSMLQGIDDHPGYDALILVGYHAMAGAKKGVLCHTWSDKVAGVWLNDLKIGEIGLNAAMAGHFQTPVIALSGDQTACLEAQTLLGPDALEVAVVKLGTGRFAAECLPLGDAREKICEAAARGVSRLKAGPPPRPYIVAAPVRLAVEFAYPQHVDRAFLMPGTVRGSGTRIEYTAADLVEAVRAFRALVLLAGD